MPRLLTIAMLAGLAAVLAGGCSRTSAAAADHDPTAEAAASVGKSRNLEAGVPPMCYTKTGGTSNPCWVCHTRGVGQNHLTDWDLQLDYAFSDTALANHWSNLFRDRSRFVAEVSDDEILDYVRRDNYEPLRRALSARARDGKYPGYVPDLDFARGVDEQGFARDGSGWRAIRFHPFAGSFWPTNGSTDDVFIRLPAEFQKGADGRPSRPIYRLNLAVVEAAIASDPTAAVVDRVVEPVDERLTSSTSTATAASPAARPASAACRRTTPVARRPLPCCATCTRAAPSSSTACATSIRTPPRSPRAA